jgi:hypothetical protein
MLDHRGQLLRAAVGFAGCSMPSYDRALHALRIWLDSWSGIGHVAVGMARQGFDLQLTRYDEKGWRATFYTTGMEHSPTSATGTAWARRGARRSGRRGKHSDNARMTSHPPRVQTRGFLGRAGRGTPLQHRVLDRSRAHRHLVGADDVLHRQPRAFAFRRPIRVWGAHERVTMKRTGGA